MAPTPSKDGAGFVAFGGGVRRGTGGGRLLFEERGDESREAAIAKLLIANAPLVAKLAPGTVDDVLKQPYFRKLPLSLPPRIWGTKWRGGAQGFDQLQCAVAARDDTASVRDAHPARGHLLQLFANPFRPLIPWRG